MTENAQFVSLRGVRKSFDNLEVLHGIDLDVAEHKVVCLIGASGSGKSTLLRCINLLEKIDEGTIAVDGQTVTGTKLDVNRLRQKIGIVFQAYNLFPHLTVLQNVTLAPRKALGISRDKAEAHARALLRQIGLDDKADEFPDRLSGGQQQRVAIARALVGQPQILFADEPTGNLDTETGAAVMNAFAELERDGLTIILVTHEPVIAERAARTITLRDGVIASDQRRERRAS